MHDTTWEFHWLLSIVCCTRVAWLRSHICHTQFKKFEIIKFVYSAYKAWLRQICTFSAWNRLSSNLYYIFVVLNKKNFNFAYHNKCNLCGRNGNAAVLGICESRSISTLVVITIFHLRVTLRVITQKVCVLYYLCTSVIINFLTSWRSHRLLYYKHLSIGKFKKSSYIVEYKFCLLEIWNITHLFLLAH